MVLLRLFLYRQFGIFCYLHYFPFLNAVPEVISRDRDIKSEKNLNKQTSDSAKAYGGSWNMDMQCAAVRTCSGVRREPVQPEIIRFFV